MSGIYVIDIAENCVEFSIMNSLSSVNEKADMTKFGM